MTSLVDRYVAAAADDFPGSDNATTSRDVRAAVEDMVEARLAEGLTREQAERAAIEELGDPKLFAEQFRQEPRYLIGPKLFNLWWKTIRVVIAIVVPLFIALAAIEYFASDSDNSYEFLGEIISATFEGVIQASFWVTLFFAIFQFAGATDELKQEQVWSPDDLPEIQTGRQITIGTVIISLVSLIGATYMAMRLREDHLGALGLNHFYDLPANTPVFNPELSNWWGIGFIALLVFSLIISVWSFVRGYWTREVLAINLLDCAVWIVFLIALGSAGDILNPVIVDASNQSNSWSITSENSSQVIIGILLLIVAWSVFEPVKGHLDFRKQHRSG